MTKWNTDKARGLSVGIGLMVAIILVDAGLIWLAADQRAVNVGTFIVGLSILFSLGLLVLIGYWLYGLTLSEYTLDRNALIIRWGPVEHVIPSEQIKRVLTGDEVEGRIRIYSGGMWPGHCVGYGEVPGEGPALFYATVPPQAQIYIVTSDITYGVSPANREVFLESFRERWEMGPTQAVEQSSRRPGFLAWPIWQDRLGLGLLVIGFLVLLALVGLLCFQFSALPLLVPLHFDATGAPDRLGPRGQIFTIPLIGFLVLLINLSLGWLAYRRERMLSYLLWGGVILVQALMWVAAVGILEYS
ncbi:MAG: PH domain-containing protein [Chloroflexi bacterium]|nr:PH domain-containing protein [Chloroflexota bacterium]